MKYTSFEKFLELKEEASGAISTVLYSNDDRKKFPHRNPEYHTYTLQITHDGKIRVVDYACDRDPSGGYVHGTKIAYEGDAAGALNYVLGQLPGNEPYEEARKLLLHWYRQQGRNPQELPDPSRERWMRDRLHQ